MRPEVQAFIQDCEKLAGLAHQNELTHEEREVIVNFAGSLVKELTPPSPLLDMDDPPLAATLSTFPPID